VSHHTVLESDKEAVVRFGFDFDYVPVHGILTTFMPVARSLPGAVFSRQKRQSSSSSFLCVIAHSPSPDSKPGVAVGPRLPPGCRCPRWLRTRRIERENAVEDGRCKTYGSRFPRTH
jgi:hypothetical protein